MYHFALTSFPSRRRREGGKTPRARAFAILLLMAAAASVPAQSGGGFDLTWSSIDGGGVESSGGAYALYGTAGQPDAGSLAAGGFDLVGGFWNHDSAQVPVELSAFALD